MLQALPDALPHAWSTWLGALRQPVVLVLGTGWGRPEKSLLEAIRAELRALGAALVVASEHESFCFRPDAPDDPLPAALASPEGLATLVRRYALRTQGLDERVSITLLDERGCARLQSTRVVRGSLGEAVLETLRAAGERAVEDGRLRFSRREVVLASLMAAITFPFVAEGDALHPLQAAFVKEDALQCGYCTPGQIMRAAGLLREDQAHAGDEIREHVSGNPCRSGAYANIVRAIQSDREGGTPT